jgi:uncharacterized protein (TIGR03000 family)
MRKIVLIVGVAMLAVVLSADDAFAQRGRGGRGGGYYGGGYYGRGNYGGNYGRGYYHDGFYGGWGYPLGFGYGYGGYYYPSYNSGSAYYPYYDSTYYDLGSSYYLPNTYAQAPMTQSRQSFYSDPNAATINVMVPNADAKIWFDGTPTQQSGMERTFVTSLQQAGAYTVKARWDSANGPVTQERQVRVQPGQMATVDFRSEGVTSPRPKQ